MYQFFVEDEQIANDLVIIEGSDVNHIRNVLRMKCGEKVRISSTSGRNFFGTIDRIAENVVEVCITEETAGLATLSILMYHIESVSEAEEERDQP